MAHARTVAQQNSREASKPKRVKALRAAPNTGTMAVAAAVPVDKPLTDMQKAFVLARAKGESIPNAMQSAGYNEQPSYGYRLDKMPNIQAAMSVERALYAEASQMTRKKVIDMQLDAFDMARMMSEPASMVSAAREIGKICGLYEPQKVDINMNGTIQHEVHRFETMSDTDLLDLLAKGASALEGPQ